jgi:hypothetical protein
LEEECPKGEVVIKKLPPPNPLLNQGGELIKFSCFFPCPIYNGQMSGEEKKLKDPTAITDISITDISFSISYTKTHKLITALYMVTDIIDKEEPIRGKLRNLGAEIISDMHSAPAGAGNKIAEVVSFLNIASAMNFISEMNCSILKKEFFELKVSIQEYIDMKPAWLADFFENSKFPPLLDKEGVGGGNSEITTSPFGRSFSTRRRELNSKGHLPARAGTRIGVQKGSTLLKAIKDMSDKTNTLGLAPRVQDFDILKKKRRDDIINIIKTAGGNATIKDIPLSSCSKKTLQRELISMVKDGVLNKTGEKRWSRYSLISPSP